MSVLSPEMVQEKLRSLPHWKLEGKEIVRHFEFPDFVQPWLSLTRLPRRRRTPGTTRISISGTTRCG